MNFSRLSVLAVFLMMIMSAFVAIPTYNVGADEHEGEDEGPVPESFHVIAEMNTLEEWTITFEVDMPTDWSDDMREDLAGMCADMMGTDEGEITEECFGQWIEMINSDDGGDDGDGMGCPPSLTELQCENFMSCMDENGDIICSMLEFQRNLYNICNDDDSHEFCYFDGEDGREFFNNIFAYEDGDIEPEDLMEAIIDEYGTGTEDYTEPAAYDIQSLYIGEEDAGTYGIYPEFLSSESPNFVCGNGGEIPFYLVNDGQWTCGDGSDEQQYDDDGNETNWFDCHDGSEVWVNQVNDGEWNCPDGEDEYQEYYWGGNVYMYSGIVEDPEDIDSLIGGIAYYCGWQDDDEVEIFCATYGEADLSAGNYSILTTGSCYDEWTDDDEDGEDDSHELTCQTGDYNHTVVDSDGNPVTYFAGSVDETRMMEIGSAHYDSTDYNAGNFPLYDTYELTVGEDGFNGAWTSVQWECYDYDGDGEDDECWGADLALYLYEYSFNPDDPYDNILGANNDFYDEDLDSCPKEDCGQSVLQVELSEGTYVFVTAGYGTYSSGFYVNQLVDQNGEIGDQWWGELKGSYWDNANDGGEVYRTVAYDGSVYDLAFEEFWNEAYEFEWEDEHQKAVEYEFGSVHDLYENYGDVLETEGSDCDGCTGNLDTMDADTSFDIPNQTEFENWADNYAFESYYFQFMDDNENGVYDSGEIYAVSSEGYDEGGQEVIVEGDDRARIPPTYVFEETGGGDPFWNLYMDIIDTIASYQDGTSTPLEAADKIVELVYQADAMGLYDDNDGDGDGMMDWESWNYCEWEGDDWEGDTMWYCTDNANGNDGFDDWWYYCEEFENIWYCTDGFGQSSDYEFSADNTHYKDGGRPDGSDGGGDDDDYDDHSRLDGIIGVEDPPNSDPDISPTNLVGALSDNEGLPMMYAGQFTLTFEGADDSLDMHEIYIPVDDGTWSVEMILQDGYEVMSCEGCEDLEIDRNNARFSADEPVTVTFGLLPDCDYVVGIDSTGYVFDPVELTINVGETVCWQWTDALDTHNVIETIGQYNSEMNLTAIDVGFYSPDTSYYYSSNTVDFRHTFTEDDMTHYYVCGPHASMGMVGKVTVGEGSEEDPVQEIVDESGLPSVGFIVGALVLVGAAGLRRRH